MPSGMVIAQCKSRMHLGFRLSSPQRWSERGSPGREILRDTRRDKSPGDHLWSRDALPAGVSWGNLAAVP